MNRMHYPVYHGYTLSKWRPSNVAGMIFIFLLPTFLPLTPPTLTWDSMHQRVTYGKRVTPRTYPRPGSYIRSGCLVYPG